MKYVPNTLSFARIGGAAILLLGALTILPIPPLSFSFFVIYIFCVITDLIDGPIARKTNTVSGFGSALDSIADVILIFTVLGILIPILNFQMWKFVCIVLVIIVRVVAIIIGFRKFTTIMLLHTYSSKLTSLLLAAVPIFIVFFENFFGRDTAFGISFGIAAAVAIFSAFDELVIVIRSKELKRDVVSMFHMKEI